MKLGFIGSGKVARALGFDLAEKGFEISGYYSPNLSKHIQLDRAYIQGMAFNTSADVVNTSDITFICVKDDALSDVVQTLKEAYVTNQVKKDNTYLIHTSGVHASDIFSPLDQYGVHGYSLHPLQSFASAEAGKAQLKETYFSFEGTHVDKIVDNFLLNSGYPHFKMALESKIKYHAAACILSNYLVTTLDFGIQMMATLGIDDALARRAIWPLVQGTIKNIENKGTTEALTGPIARGDILTIQKHLSSLEGFDKKLYTTLGIKTLEIASRKNVNQEAYYAIKKILEEE